MSFIMILLLSSFKWFAAYKINAHAFGILTIALLYMTGCFSFRQIIAGFSYERVFIVVGMLAVIKMVTSSSIGTVVGMMLKSSIGTSTSTYFIFTVLFAVTAVLTQFMNNMTACGVICPIGIELARSLGADPRAFVMAIAIAAGCGYLTPFSSRDKSKNVCFRRVDHYRLHPLRMALDYYYLCRFCADSA